MKKSILTRYYIVKALLILLCCLLMVSCAAPVHDATGEELQRFFDDRAAFLSAGEEQAFAATVDPLDPALTAEQAALARSAQICDAFGCEMEVQQYERQKEGLYFVLVKQTYRVEDEQRSVRYIARVTQTEGEYHFAGYLPNHESTADVRVNYAKGLKKQAAALLQIESDVLKTLNLHFGYTPQTRVCLSLYDDQKVFLQSVKVLIPDWVAGWHEAGETIRLYYNPYNTLSSYEKTLTHETAHLMLCELTNDNAAYWLQEGIATLMETTRGTLTDISAQRHAINNVLPFAELARQDVEQLSGDETNLYYDSAQAYAAMLIEEIGWEGLQPFFLKLAENDSLDCTAQEKLAYNNELTLQALRQVLNLQEEDMDVMMSRWSGQ